jgi:hypothetical protein
MCGTAILSVVYYECAAWSVILREEHSLRIFENTALRGMFWPVREQATGNRRRMYNEEPRDFFCPLNITGVMTL